MAEGPAPACSSMSEAHADESLPRNFAIQMATWTTLSYQQAVSCRYVYGRMTTGHALYSEVAMARGHWRRLRSLWLVL